MKTRPGTVSFFSLIRFPNPYMLSDRKHRTKTRFVCKKRQRCSKPVKSVSRDTETMTSAQISPVTQKSADLVVEMALIDRVCGSSVATPGPNPGQRLYPSTLTLGREGRYCRVIYG